MTGINPHTFVNKTSPPQFDIDTEGPDFVIWKARWNAFRVQSGIANLQIQDAAQDAAAADTPATIALKAKAQQINYTALISSVSNNTLRVIQNLALPQEDKEDAEKIIPALEKFIQGGVNKRVYRKQFAERKQADGESVGTYIVALRDLATKCAFTATANPTNDRIMDQLMLGAHDSEIQQKLLILKDL